MHNSSLKQSPRLCTSERLGLATLGIGEQDLRITHALHRSIKRSLLF